MQFLGVSGIKRAADGTLWLGDAGGVVQVPPDEVRRATEQPGYRMTARRFGENDGLLGTVTQMQRIPSIAISGDGRVWVETDSGIGMIDPHRLAAPASAPTVEVRGIAADGTDLALADVVELPQRLSMLQVDYTAPSVRDGEKLRFAYTLDGYENAWHEVGSQRQAVYTHLPPGSYTLKIAATLLDGAAPSNPAQLRIVVPPAYWQTWWFKALMALATIACVVAAYAVRLRSVAERARASSEAKVIERERIARELHDTVLQGVTALTLQVRAALEQLPKESQARGRLGTALDVARNVLSEGRSRVTDLRANQSATLLGRALSQSLADACEELARHYPTPSYRVEREGDEPQLPYDLAVELYLIAREALTNAFRHSQASEIEVRVAYTAEQVSVTVFDNGVGMPSARGAVLERLGHFGIEGMKERAAASARVIAPGDEKDKRARCVGSGIDGAPLAAYLHPKNRNHFAEDALFPACSRGASMRVRRLDFEGFEMVGSAN